MLAPTARNVDDGGSSRGDLVVGLAQQSAVRPERAKRRVAASPPGPGAAAAAVGRVAARRARDDGVAVRAGVSGAAHHVAVGGLVAHGGYEGGVVGQGLARFLSLGRSTASCWI